MQLEFRYVISNRDGTVLASGSDRVYQAYYQYYDEWSLTQVSFNPAYYETRAMGGWLAGVLKDLSASARAESPRGSDKAGA